MTDNMHARSASKPVFFVTNQEVVLAPAFFGPSTVPAAAQVVVPNAFWINLSTVTGEQQDKLINFFNNYQQFRPWGLKATFTPAMTESVSVVNFTTATPGNLNSSRVYASNTQIVLVPEHDDLEVRNNNLDELWQAKLLPNAHSFISTQKGEIFIRFTDLEAEANFDSNGVTPPIVVPATNSMASAIHATEWKATKTIQVQGGSYELNAYQTNLGMKLYMYNPYYAGLTAIASPIVDTPILGTLSFQIYWQFRNWDNRAPITSLTLLSLEDKTRLIARPTSLDINELTGASNKQRLITLPQTEDADMQQSVKRKREL